MKNLEKRYYQEQMSAKGKMQQVFEKIVKNQMVLRKHDKVRKDPQERQKLDRIDDELGHNSSLKQVDIHSHEHERATN